MNALDDQSIDENDTPDKWSSWCMKCSDGGKLICCDGCRNAFHGKCRDPKVPSKLCTMIDAGSWTKKVFCSECLKKGKKDDPYPAGIRTPGRQRAAPPPPPVDDIRIPISPPKFTAPKDPMNALTRFPPRPLAPPMPPSPPPRRSQYEHADSHDQDITSILMARSAAGVWHRQFSNIFEGLDRSARVAERLECCEAELRWKDIRTTSLAHKLDVLQESIERFNRCNERLYVAYREAMIKNGQHPLSLDYFNSPYNEDDEVTHNDGDQSQSGGVRRSIRDDDDDGDVDIDDDIPIPMPMPTSTSHPLPIVPDNEEIIESDNEQLDEHAPRRTLDYAVNDDDDDMNDDDDVAIVEPPKVPERSRNRSRT